MKLYTFYTDSHSRLLNNYFLPSVPKNDDIELVVEKFPQECSSGNFMEDGWKNTMIKKVEYILKSINECYGDSFIHSDCDIEFYKPITNDLKYQLEDYDIAAMEDGPDNMCCGFFICKANNKTKQLFEHIRDNMNNYENDQIAFNTLKNKYITSKFLNKKYYNVSFSIGMQVWNPDIAINNVDKDIILTHANYVIGIDNKCKLLDNIKKLIK